MPDPTYHLRKQIADLTWQITHEPNVRKADALRRNIRPLERELSRLMNRYPPVRAQEREEPEPVGNFGDNQD